MLSLSDAALLAVELVECRFNSPARYFVSLQLSLPGATDAVHERTEVSASSQNPAFSKSSFEFRLPAGLSLAEAGGSGGELIVSAVSPELEEAREGDPPKGSTRIVGSVAVDVAEAVRGVQQSDDRELVRECPLGAPPTAADPLDGPPSVSAGMVRLRLRLLAPPPPPPLQPAAPRSTAVVPAEAETRVQASAARAAGVPAELELAHKQALIDRLLDDVDKRANAVTRCGQEIMELRALNKHQEQELSAQRQAAVERERQMEQLASDAANVEHIDLPELQRRHRLLAAAYRSDRRRMEQLGALNAQYATSLATQGQLQAAYASLKEAHRQQATQVLRLQEEGKKVGKYRQAARQQEQIIVRMEGLMGAALRDAKRAQALEPELSEVRGQLRQAREELGKQREMPAAATEEQVKLLMRAEKAERRATAVEDEMTEMARRSAREIAALKLKLAEKEAQLMGGFGSPANLVLGELPAADGLADDPLLAPSRDVSTRSLRLPPRAPSTLSSSARRLSPRLDPLAAAGPPAPAPAVETAAPAAAGGEIAS